MIGLLLCMAWADPVALRAPVHAPAATVGLHDASVGAALGETWLAAEVATNGASAGASVGRRWVLGRDDRVRRIQAGASGGVLVNLVEPGLAVTGTGWLHAGWVGDRGTFVAGVAVPLALGSGGLRLPVLFELQGGVRVGPVWLGGRLSAGPVVTPGTDVSTFLEPALMLQLDRSSSTARQ